MKKFLVLLALVAAAAYFFVWPRLKLAIDPPYTDLARTRVEHVLQAMQGTSDPKWGPADQFGTSVWAANRFALDRDGLEHYSPLYDTFRVSHGLYHKIQAYEIVDVTDASTEAGRSAIVRLRIDGSRFTWIVPEKSQIAWGENSRS